MKYKNIHYCLLLFPLVYLYTCSACPVSAEVVVDADFKEKSIINQRSRSAPNIYIRGGARRQRNLFHRFREFEPGSRTVNFVSPKGIKNIFGIVTGNKQSTIRGNVNFVENDLVTVAPTNFYLLNPNGIRIINGARFNLKGDLTLSTANRIDFRRGSLRITSRQHIPLFTSDPNNFAIVGREPESINLINSSINTSPSQNISLLGGDIRLNNSTIEANDGSILVRSRSEPGKLNLSSSSEDSLRYLINSEGLGDISLLRESSLRSRGSSLQSISRDSNNSTRTPKIDILGNNITVRGSSFIFTDAPNTDISVVSSGRLNLVDNSSFTSTASNGDLLVSSRSGINLSAAFFFVNDGQIRAQVLDGNLNLVRRSSINSETSDVFINVGGTIRLGRNPQNTEDEDTEDEDFSNINGQSIFIEASELLLWNQSNINTVPLDDSLQPGDIKIIAKDRVFLQGSNEDPETSSTISSETNFTSRDQAGEISILTPSLELVNGASIRASSTQGVASQITISADRVELDNGEITSRTRENERASANIILNVSDLLSLDNDSLINAEATAATTGGNILILNTPTIQAQSVAGRGNDIIADALLGTGGNIIIDSQNDLESQFTERASSDTSNLETNGVNDIRASGVRPGLVDIDTVSEINQGLIELPQTVVDPDSLIAQNPCSRGSESEYTLSGRGGLPGGVKQSLNNDHSQVDFIAPPTISNTEQTQTTLSGMKISTESPVIAKLPAQGWVYDQTGKIQLIAYQNQVTPETIRKPRSPQSCSS